MEKAFKFLEYKSVDSLRIFILSSPNLDNLKTSQIKHMFNETLYNFLTTLMS